MRLEHALAQEQLFIEGILGYGTSEGALKGWDSRGRGRKQSGGAKRLSRSESGELVIAAPTKGQAKRIRSDYESLGKKIDTLAKKIDNPAHVKGVGWKFLHLLKRVADWIEPYKNLAEVAGVAGYAVWHVMKHVDTQAAKAVSVFSWAYAHIAPLITTITEHAHRIVSGLS